jgi:hypothetical protein
MKLSFALLLTVSFILAGCMEREGSEYDSIPDSLIIDLLSTSPDNNNPGDSSEALAMLRSYRFGILPLVPDSPDNQYLPSGMEVSVNTVGKDGGVVVIGAGYPKGEGRIMNDSFITSFGDAYQLPANHFSVERKVLDSSRVEYSISAKENKTGKDLVFYVEISDYGTTADGKPYYNKALIVIEQAG